ncbi:putative neural cell adhesion molecule l1, partial [Operophtera brumata]
RYLQASKTNVHFCLSPGAGGLRTTELRVIPRVAQRGRNVTLACLYELQEDYGIYSVKWYKGTQEFYRYSPLDTPSTKVSNVAGIKVDRFNSNETHVILLRVAPNQSGNYSCEVIQNAPSYPHYKGAIDLRISPPVVERGSTATLACLYELTDAPLYSLANSNQSQVVLTKVSFGLSGNFSCEVTADAPSFATPPSKNTDPNNEPALLHSGRHPESELFVGAQSSAVTPGQYQVHPVSEGLLRADLNVQVQLWPAHYERGAPILRCEAKVGALYREDNTVALEVMIK